MSQLDLLKDWLWLLSLAAPVAAAASLWWLSQRFASRSYVDRVDAKVRAATERLALVEQKVSALPTAEAFMIMRETLARVEVMTESNTAMLSTIQKHLLRQDQ